MRGVTLLTATILTFGYGFAAQAAMTIDRAETFRRVAARTVESPAPALDANRVRTVETPDPALDANRVWYGGMLAPVVVEARAPAKCTHI